MPCVVQGHDLPVHYRLVRQRSQGGHDGPVAPVKVLVVPRPQVNASAGLKGQCAVAVKSS
jgi:hypothetical protein